MWFCWRKNREESAGPSVSRFDAQIFEKALGADVYEQTHAARFSFAVEQMFNHQGGSERISHIKLTSISL